MLLENPDSLRIAASLLSRAGSAAGGAQVAELVVATLHEFGVALVPIVGRRGVAALYARSVHLAASIHPWLAAAGDSQRTSIDDARLQSVLSGQSGADAAAGAATLLQTFHDVLVSLIGASLTERLLRSAWATLLSGPAAQDTSP